ncbi:YcnI family copper-binding membrane protein [Amycolatopsis sp. NPDC003861]
MSRTSITRALAGTALLATISLALPGTAWAHLEPEPGTVAQGKTAEVDFTVPNERPTAGTVVVHLQFPKEYPVVSLKAQTTAGWKVTVDKVKLDPPLTRDGATFTEVVGGITWTAQPGLRINPGEYAKFGVSFGPMPKDAQSFTMTATQTYDSGEVVNWDQPPPAEGAEEPEHPAPTLKLTAAGTESDEGGEAAAAPSAAAAPASDDTARLLGGAGLVVAALAAGIAIGALLRGRRKPPATGPQDDGTTTG